MALFNSLVTWYLKKRIPNIERFNNRPFEVQQELFEHLIETAKDTEWGKLYDYKSIKSIEDFRERVPIGNYESHKPYIERMMRGEQNILWPSEVRWFAKSSGTTGAKSKFIPITYESLEECHFQGGKDSLLFYSLNNPESKIFDGKGLVIGGSHQLNKFNAESYYGDLSAVMMQNLPFWAHYFRTPDLDIAIMDNWDEKIEKMVAATRNDDVTNISGVPTWTLVLIEKLFEVTGKSNLLDIWPNLELYIHGGVSFTPYRERFKKLIKSNSVSYLETYNASEGFIGIQDMQLSNDMLLMLDYGIFFEFMPMDEYGKEFPKTCSLFDVEEDVNYALIISTNAGLWRYIIGDTIKFTSTSPFRFKITGRTKHFINAFGEELIIENADLAISNACKKHNAMIADYTAGPIHFTHKQIGTHEWIIEFDKEPESLAQFAVDLDEQLKSINSDYEAKRFKNIAMAEPIIRCVPKGTFQNWLKIAGKLGGQHKVPRLSNTREYVEDILQSSLQTRS